MPNVRVGQYSFTQQNGHVTLHALFNVLSRAHAILSLPVTLTHHQNPLHDWLICSRDLCASVCLKSETTGNN